MRSASIGIAFNGHLKRRSVFPYTALAAKSLVDKFANQMEMEEYDTFDISFFENVLRRNARDIDALELLGGLYSKYEQPKQTLRIDRKLARLLPADARIRYNLACSLSLLRRKRDAVATLEIAIELGYNDADWLVQDPDLEPLKGYPQFETLLAQLQRNSPVKPRTPRSSPLR